MAEQGQNLNPAVGDQPPGLLDEARLVVTVPPAADDQCRRLNRRQAGQVEAVLGLSHRRHVVKPLASQQARADKATGRSSQQRERADRSQIGGDHGTGLRDRFGSYSRRHLTLHQSRRRSEPAAGADQDQSPHHVWVLGRDLLRDAATGRHPQ